MMPSEPIPIDECRKLFRYDPETGQIHRLTVHGRFPAGTECGTHKKDYLYVQYGKKVILFHRLAWALHYGEWPKLTIDHINLDRFDNRIANLRQATVAQNIRNRPMQKNNKTGFKGVCRHKKSGKYSAKIVYEAVRYHLGQFDTAEAAFAAYMNKAAELHGEFFCPSEGANHAR